MCSDAVQESYSLWFMTVEESQAKLPDTGHGVGSYSLRLKDMVPLFIW